MAGRKGAVLHTDGTQKFSGAQPTPKRSTWNIPQNFSGPSQSETSRQSTFLIGSNNGDAEVFNVPYRKKRLHPTFAVTVQIHLMGTSGMSPKFLQQRLREWCHRFHINLIQLLWNRQLYLFGATWFMTRVRPVMIKCSHDRND
jgi:hypothetical protein